MLHTLTAVIHLMHYCLNHVVPNCPKGSDLYNNQKKQKYEKMIFFFLNYLVTPQIDLQIYGYLRCSF